MHHQQGVSRVIAGHLTEQPDGIIYGVAHVVLYGGRSRTIANQKSAFI